MSPTELILGIALAVACGLAALGAVVIHPVATGERLLQSINQDKPTEIHQVTPEEAPEYTSPNGVFCPNTLVCKQ